MLAPVQSQFLPLHIHIPPTHLVSDAPININLNPVAPPMAHHTPGNSSSTMECGGQDAALAPPRLRTIHHPRRPLRPSNLAPRHRTNAIHRHQYTNPQKKKSAQFPRTQTVTPIITTTCAKSPRKKTCQNRGKS